MDNHPELEMQLDPLDLDVEVLVAGDWVRSRAHESRRGIEGRETLVSWAQMDGDRHLIRTAWFRSSHIRAVHLAD